MLQKYTIHKMLIWKNFFFSLHNNVKEKKSPEYINDDTEISSDDSDEENSDEGSSNKEY